MNNSMFFGLRPVLGRLFRYAKKQKNKVSFFIWRWYSLRRYGTLREVKTFYNNSLTVRTNDWRSYWIWKEKGTQQKLIDVWLGHLPYQPDLFIDVGANYGEFSSALCNREIDVIAIEPNPEIFECLNLTMAKCHQSKVINMAVGNARQDNINLYYKPLMSGYSSLSKEVVAPHTSPAGLNDEVKVGTINMDRLDSIIYQIYNKYPCCFVMKIDVEGYEQEALEGAKDLINNATWWRGIIEFNPKAIRARGIDPVEVWSSYRKFNGLIIETEYSNRIAEINSLSLPDCPVNACNILIGRGQVTKQGVHQT